MERAQDGPHVLAWTSQSLGFGEVFRKDHFQQLTHPLQPSQSIRPRGEEAQHSSSACPCLVFRRVTLRI